MKIEKIIEEFKKLDLSTYPKKEIMELFNDVGNIASCIVTFPKGKSIIRARPNYNNERFSKKSDFSFKPQKLNRSYQRASKPDQTMFYATSIPENLERGELDNMRVIGVFETIPMLRNNNKETSGYQKISFGRWYVEEEINLMAMVHERTYYDQSKYTRELVDGYEKFNRNVEKKIVEKSLKIQEFLASEFSKEKINGDYDYMISSIFSQNVVKNGLDGIMYPSVRTGGNGFNVALTPKAVKNLGLYVVGECSVYKHKARVVIGNDAIIELNGKQEEFEMKDIESDQNNCLKALGFKTLDDLIKCR